MPKYKKKHKKLGEIHVFYRRPGKDTVFIRDYHGRYYWFKLAGQGSDWDVTGWGEGITDLGPQFARVDYANTSRFAGKSRSQTNLEQAFDIAGPGLKLTSGWVELPASRDNSRRQTNQGMSVTMNALTGANLSATNYAQWYVGRNPHSPVDGTTSYEWCHLLAHSLGGADGPANIVAAGKGNNTEQLGIENSLWMYAHEDCFELKVGATVQDATDGIHLGDVIRYQVRCKGVTDDGPIFNAYLDCLVEPNMSAIHFYDVVEDFCKWANKKLQALSDADANTRVTASQKKAIKDAMKEKGLLAYKPY